MNAVTFELRDYAEEPLNRQRKVRMLEIADEIDGMVDEITDRAWREGFECGKEEGERDAQVRDAAGGDAGVRDPVRPTVVKTCSNCLNWHSYDGEWGGCASFLNGGTGSSCASKADHSCGEWVGSAAEPSSEYDLGWRDGYEYCRCEMTDMCDEMVRTARREAGLNG